MVGEAGFECPADAGFSDESENACEPSKPVATSEDNEGRRRSLAALASRARLLERLLTGDERVLATEIRQGLEELRGAEAPILDLAAERAKRDAS